MRKNGAIAVLKTLTLTQIGLGRFKGDPLYRRFLIALNVFVERAQRDPLVTHILVGGSFVRGELRHDSDLDFCVIRRRGTRLRHETLQLRGVPMDVVTVTPAVARAELAVERRSFLRRFSYLLAGSVCIVGDTHVLELQRVARRVERSAAPRLSRKTLGIYADYARKQKDIMRVYLAKQDDLQFLLKLTDVVQRFVRMYFEVHSLPIPSWKHARAAIAHPGFRSALLVALQDTDMCKRLRAFCIMADHLARKTRQYNT